jgi:hypothetical protein
MKLHNPFTVIDESCDFTLYASALVLIIAVIISVTYYTVITYGNIGIAALPLTPAVLRILYAVFKGE